MKKLVAILLVGTLGVFTATSHSLAKEKFKTEAVDHFSKLEITAPNALAVSSNENLFSKEDVFTYKAISAGYATVNLRLFADRESLTAGTLPGEIKIAKIYNQYPQPINDKQPDNRLCSYMQHWRNLNLNERVSV